jgi:anti-sigma-K factor RskA
MSKIDIGKVIDIGAVVAKELTKQAAKPDTAMQPADVPKVAPPVADKIEAAVKKEVQPVIDHLTNNETHWWQKRSFWSAIVSIVGVVAAPLAARYGLDGYLTPANLDATVDALTKVAGMLAAYLAFRAGTALKPLGE